MNSLAIFLILYCLRVISFKDFIFLDIYTHRPGSFSHPPLPGFSPAVKSIGVFPLVNLLASGGLFLPRRQDCQLQVAVFFFFGLTQIHPWSIGCSMKSIVVNWTSCFHGQPHLGSAQCLHPTANSTRPRALAWAVSLIHSLVMRESWQGCV